MVDVMNETKNTIAVHRRNNDIKQIFINFGIL